MTIKLTYTTIEEKEEQVYLEKDVKEIRLGVKSLVNIDLAPLSACTNIKRLDLHWHQLQNIDLAPLSSCTNLQRLDLNGNQLQNIDLAPLSSCTNLQRLDLNGNQFQRIDLTPLSACTELSDLNLENKQLQDIDVTPLSGVSLLICSEDQKLSSWLPPSILEWSRYLEIVYSPPSQLYPWSFLYERIDQFKNDYRIQHDILAALDLADYGFIDHDLTDTFLKIAPEITTEDVREILINFLVEKITAAVDADELTTGLNLYNLVANHDEIAARAQHILELRKREIEQVRIHIENNVVDLRELWLTTYGNIILQTLGMRLITDSEGLKQIERTFTELGHQLEIGDSLVSGANMSKELRECIWWIAENNGEIWWPIGTPNMKRKA